MVIEQSEFPDYLPKMHFLSHDVLRQRYERVLCHPVWRALWDKPLTPYARSRLFEILTHKDMVDLTYAEFVAELARPRGGIIGQTRYAGKNTIEQFRRACSSETLPEYGYA